MTSARFTYHDAAAVRTERIRWLIAGMVPLRGLSVIGGEKALGKSLLAGAVWTAAVTRGECDGELKGLPRDVLLLSAEDDWESVIVPRLMATSADLKRVHFMKPTPGKPGVTLPDDVAAIADHLKYYKAIGSPVSMVVVDPVGAFLDGGIDSHRDASVRHALAPLAELAMAFDVAVVLVAHLNKSEGSRLLNRVVGSVAFVNAARSFVAFGRDPEDADGEKGTRRVVVPTACNWGPLAKSLAANVESRLVELHDGSTASVGYLNVTGESDVVVEDLQRGPGDGADGGDVQGAILDELADGKPHEPRDVKATVAGELGCSWKTVQRAAECLEADGFLHRDMARGPRLATWAAVVDTASFTQQPIVDTPLTPFMSTINSSPETLDSLLDTPHCGLVGKQGRVHKAGLDDELARLTAKYGDDDEERAA